MQNTNSYNTFFVNHTLCIKVYFPIRIVRIVKYDHLTCTLQEVQYRIPINYKDN